MSETLRDGAEKHPVDAFFERMGLPEGFGEGDMPFHDRVIKRRDYFDQPDVDPGARLVFDRLSTMDPSDPQFPKYAEAFRDATKRFVG